MNFFSSLATFNATPYARAKIVKQPDLLSTAKAKFARACDEQIKLVKAAADKGLWFKLEHSKYHVTLKNGVAALNKASPSFTVPNAATAVQFIEAAKLASAAGEFDALFVETSRGPRKVKAVTVDHSASDATIAAVLASEAKPEDAPKPAKKK
jgi:hypothetical protein